MTAANLKCSNENDELRMHTTNSFMGKDSNGAVVVYTSLCESCGLQREAMAIVNPGKPSIQFEFEYFPAQIEA